MDRVTAPGTSVRTITFERAGVDGAARRGRLHTGHGTVETPAFMPVGTRGTVKTLGAEDLDEIEVRMALANTYHLMLRPGVEVVEAAGGLHRFTSMHCALLTDSGGYQVMSLSDLARVDADGVEFRSHLDGSKHRLTPEGTVLLQARLGADVVMCLDECVPAGAGRERAALAVQRTRDWALRAVRARGTRFSTYDYPQALFGIVQGWIDPELRRASAADLTALDFPGYAVGGLAVGEPKPSMLEVLELMDTLLPADRPRYLMGVGYPEDLVAAVARGIDLFDCVLPTRNARNGMLFTRRGRIGLRHAALANDHGPLDPDCACRMCARYSRAYVRHLHQSGEILGLRIATYHNVFFYQALMRDMRAAIEAGRFESWAREFLAGQAGGSVERPDRR